MTTYNTNLAAEFYVLSMLHRLGADAALTLGNKKAVDIIVVNGNGTTTQKQFYSFTDIPSEEGIYLYRIKQIDFDGNFKYSNQIEVYFILITNFALLQNYPNPFNLTTTISYQVPYSNKVVIKVFDVLGSELAILVDEVKPSGIHEITFDASGLPSGIYFYKLESGGYAKTKKMILLK